MMNRRCNPSSRRRGLTLIEVIAALLLLGVVLSAVLMARGRAMAQWAEANRRLDAMERLETQLRQWGEAVPETGGGALPGEPAMRWRTRVVREESRLRVVAVEVVDGRGVVLAMVEVAGGVP